MRAFWHDRMKLAKTAGVLWALAALFQFLAVASGGGILNVISGTIFAGLAFFQFYFVIPDYKKRGL